MNFEQISTWSRSDKLKLYRQLQHDLFDGKNQLTETEYVLFDVGYTSRLQSNEQLDIIYDYLEELELEAEILFIEGEGHRFDVFRRDGAYVEHPEAREFHSKINESLQKTYSPRKMIGVKFSRPANEFEMQDFTQAIIECDHCGGLSPQCHYQFELRINFQGQERVIRIREYDTESG